MKIKNNLSWIYYIAKRFSIVDLKGAGAWTARLSTLGICFGVMTLIIVVSVMNGFQSEFIDAIMEVSSYHARVQAPDGNNAALQNFLSQNENVLLASEFVESESLASSASGKQSALLVRGIDAAALQSDKGFARELKIIRGVFDLQKKYKRDGAELVPIVLGSSLARALDVRVGDLVSLYSIASNRPLLESFSKPKSFVVQAIFRTGYAEINSSCAFVEKSCAQEFFEQSPLVLGVKLKNPSRDALLQSQLLEKFPDANFLSWRDFNRSFFGALKIEKNMLMLLVVLIFVVVAINIFNSMRRMVYERRFEISTLSALGGQISSIKNIFIMRGFLTGVRGSLPGLALGMFFCVNIKKVFAVLSASIFYVQSAFAMFFAPELLATMAQNPMFSVYGNIPARMRAPEICFITLFGILSAVVSSWAASREVLGTSISEVLHDE